MSIKKENSLIESRLFKETMNCGKKYVFDSFILFHKRYKSNTKFQIGIIASKKVGGAVERNRAKRLVRSAISHHLHKFSKEDTFIIICRKNILNKNSNDLIVDFDKALSKFEV